VGLPVKLEARLYPGDGSMEVDRSRWLAPVHLCLLLLVVLGAWALGRARPDMTPNRPATTTTPRIRGAVAALLLLPILPVAWGFIATVSKFEVEASNCDQVVQKQSPEFEEAVTRAKSARSKADALADRIRVAASRSELRTSTRLAIRALEQERRAVQAAAEVRSQSRTDSAATKDACDSTGRLTALESMILAVLLYALAVAAPLVVVAIRRVDAPAPLLRLHRACQVLCALGSVVGLGVLVALGGWLTTDGAGLSFNIFVFGVVTTAVLALVLPAE
jgi:hypothetical protein